MSRLPNHIVSEDRFWARSYSCCIVPHRCIPSQSNAAVAISTGTSTTYNRVRRLIRHCFQQNRFSAKAFKTEDPMKYPLNTKNTVTAACQRRTIAAAIHRIISNIPDANGGVLYCLEMPEFSFFRTMTIP